MWERNKNTAIEKGISGELDWRGLVAAQRRLALHIWLHKKTGSHTEGL
jgi:hypothetical protein